MSALKLLLLSIAVMGCVPKASTEPKAKERSFDELNHEERLVYMKDVVMPAMEPVFWEHAPERFKSFGCKTCHGSSVDDEVYTMPNEDLPKLGGDLTKQFKPEDLEWMLTEVKPRMAKLLKTKEWSPADPYGFDCYSCHERAR